MNPQALNPFDVGAILIVLAALFGWVNHHYIRLPHSIGLTVTGAVTALCLASVDLLVPDLGVSTTIRSFLDRVDFHATLMDGMLSFLLFAGALHVDLSHLLRRKWAVLSLATVGVLISTVIVGAGFKALTLLFGINLSWLWCLVFGALISPTDPVAVLAILKSARVPATLEAKIAGESLFNDGIGVVLFSILLAAAAGQEVFSPSDAAALFAQEVAGGVLLGFLSGWIGYQAMKACDDANLEVLITLAVVMGGYTLAHQIHVAGPVAMSVAGLLIGNHGTKHAMSETVRVHVQMFWSLLDEMLNSVLFLLIGLQIVVLTSAAKGLTIGTIAIILVLGARAAAVALPISLLARWTPFTQGTVPILVWGGLRGGISIALALSLPPGPIRDLLLAATFVIVLFSVIVQGSTVSRVAKHFVTTQDN